MIENNDKYSFESFIIQCCKAKEWNLRKFLKKTLMNAGFKIKEDDYKTYRGGKYSSVHNMLAVRGDPNVCLVAHTDICRDHAYDSPDVDPIIKIKQVNDEIQAIIQDRYCNFQVGGDDRLGVAINTWIALNTGYDMGLLFTTDEEIGVVSAEYLNFSELLDFDILVQVDRGNHSNQLVVSIGGHELCSDNTAKRLLKIASDINLPREPVNGMLTDVFAIKTNGMCKNAVNMTCGYHNSWGADKTEFINIQESKDTMKYVSNIIKDYYLNKNTNEEFNLEKEKYNFNIEEEAYEQPLYACENISNPSRRKRQKINNDLWSEENYNRDKRNYDF